MNKNPILDYVSQGMNDDDILQQLAQAVGQYSPLDLLSKISVSSFLLKTDFFSDYQTLDNKWMAYQDALHFLIPFLGCHKLGSGEKLISPKDLDDLVSSIQRIGMLRIEKSDSESESKISYGQTEATEVLPYLDSFYIDGLLPAESPVLEKAFGISGETIVADLHTAVERQHMNPPPNGDLSPVSFSFFIEHIKDFVDEPSFSLTADLKSSVLFSQLSFGLGEFPEADFDMLSPLGLYDKKRKCFLSISGIPYCFDTEVFTSRLAKGVERLASTSDASSKEWALLKKRGPRVKRRKFFWKASRDANISKTLITAIKKVNCTK